MRDGHALRRAVERPHLARAGARARARLRVRVGVRVRCTIVPLVPPMMADSSRPPPDQVIRETVSRLVVVFANPALA